MMLYINCESRFKCLNYFIKNVKAFFLFKATWNLLLHSKEYSRFQINSISGKHTGLLFWPWKTSWRTRHWHSKGRRLCHYPHSEIFNRSLLPTKSSTNSPACYSMACTIWTQSSRPKKILLKAGYVITAQWGQKGKMPKTWKLSSRTLRSNRITSKSRNQSLWHRRAWPSAERIGGMWNRTSEERSYFQPAEPGLVEGGEPSGGQVDAFPALQHAATSLSWVWRQDFIFRWFIMMSIIWG